MEQPDIDGALIGGAVEGGELRHGPADERSLRSRIAMQHGFVFLPDNTKRTVAHSGDRPSFSRTLRLTVPLTSGILPAPRPQVTVQLRADFLRIFVHAAAPHSRLWPPVLAAAWIFRRYLAGLALALV